jgi:N-acetylmuramoyl-L-alanine amidase
VKIHTGIFLEQKRTTPTSRYNKEYERDNLVFKVQIAASNIKLSQNHPALTKHKEIDMYIHQNMYKYTVKKSTSFSEVNKFKEEISLKVERNAFVVAFLNNKRISLEEALQILNRQN